MLRRPWGMMKPLMAYPVCSKEYHPQEAWVFYRRWGEALRLPDEDAA